ncbi:hypothetical protein [Alicyclobacillus fodiniaquatilis]|uniref:Tail specific protease domain-containing protein n=1 Tax=Alicyclobacillus fodiniaquatilis TaxID=1661150 RepID=A0ABW4JJJ2_9BACL
MRIPAFSAPHLEEKALTYIHEFSKAHTIVIDIRQNSGDSTPSQLVSALMDTGADPVLEKAMELI